jgi:hypothetical protein
MSRQAARLAKNSILARDFQWDARNSLQIAGLGDGIPRDEFSDMAVLVSKPAPKTSVIRAY